MDVIRFQPGETLTEILESSGGPEQVRESSSLNKTHFTNLDHLLTHLVLCVLEIPEVVYVLNGISNTIQLTLSLTMSTTLKYAPPSPIV